MNWLGGGKGGDGREGAEGEERERGEEVAPKLTFKFIVFTKFGNYGCGGLAWKFVRFPT